MHADAWMRSAMNSLVGSRCRVTVLIKINLCGQCFLSAALSRLVEEKLSGHTLLDIDATVAKPGFKPPISMKSIQTATWPGLV